MFITFYYARGRGLKREQDASEDDTARSNEDNLDEILSTKGGPQKIRFDFSD